VGQISAGSTHTCAVRADSTAWCWGFGNDGRLGNGSIADQVRPVAVSTATGFDSVAQVSGGNAHTCGVTADGNAFCWGSDSGRQLGGPAGNRTTPQQVSLLTP
jgi:alpha-tubulin suppressor-like RCC1 family protein